MILLLAALVALAGVLVTATVIHALAYVPWWALVAVWFVLMLAMKRWEERSR